MTDKAMVTDAERAWNAMSDDMNRWDMLSEDERETFTAFAAVLAQAEQPVAVKPLEWIYAERTVGTYIARDERGDLYWINQSFGSDSYYFTTVRRFDGATLYDADDLDSAKAAAQADYERRILSALAHPPAKREAGETLKPRDNVVVDSVFGPVGGIIVEPVEGWWKVQFRDGSIAVVRPSSIRAALEGSHE